MQFDYIEMSVSKGTLKSAHTNFKKLLVELAVRDNNYHVGSGRGGNNFQLLVLMSLKHTLASSGRVSLANDGEVKWGGEWLASASMIQIRNEVNWVITQIVERQKLLALALDSLSNGGDKLRESLSKYENHFPSLKSVLHGHMPEFGAHLTNFDKLVMSFLLCQELSAELDKGQTDRIGAVGAFLKKMPSEIILLSVRRFIQIDRLVKHNLDEHPVFMGAINKVNRLVN